jgi:transposase InsO family protein
LGLNKSDKKDLVLGLYNNKDNKYSKRSLAQSIGISESCLYYESILNDKDLIVKNQIEEQYGLDDTLGAKKLSKLISHSPGKIARVMLKFNIIPRPVSPQYRYAGKSDNLVENILLSEKDITIYEVIFSDIFEFKLLNGQKVYGCFMLRKSTRQILSFSYSNNMEATLVKGSLKHMFLSKDLIESKIIFHSDQGKQFGAEITVEQLLAYNFERSMSRAGTPTDNGYAERFVGVFKHSVVNRYKYENLSQFAEFSYKWLNFYNNIRPHSSLGNKSPNNYAIEKGIEPVRVLVPNLL